MGTTIRPEISKKNEYYISRHRYYELKHFCLQYPEWKRRLRELDALRSAAYFDATAAKGRVSDPTAQCAEERLHISSRMELLERVSMQAAGDLGELLLRSVTEGLAYEYISPPCCREVWYTTYRRFFWLLSRIRD